jgi:hypothetical protein
MWRRGGVRARSSANHGLSPSTSYLGELLDERRAVMGVEMVMSCSRKGPRTQFTPELGLRLSG